MNNNNAPLFGNLFGDADLDAPIYGNNLDALNIPIYGNNNNNINNNNINSINDNNSSKSMSGSGNVVINNSISNNMNQPLLEDNNIINTSNNKNINNINNNNNMNINDAVNNAINDLALPESNEIFNIRKGNPYVNQEKDRLEARNDLTTRIEGLKMTFFNCCSKNIRAINNLYLGLEANEKFGLLGFNGSGKTTTFKAITNEILYDYGRITIFGADNRKQFDRIKSRIGYCPQENPLFEFMKVREILEFYSDLKTCNVPINVICEKFGLTKYLDTFCINLSGGNKRKLTFAIAIMNRPSLLLLDEPSTGVDPESRRYMWKNINELSKSGLKYNMILTTHSMEEAEILCDRVSWLKKGNFVCIGNPERLKMQYSFGYKLHVRFDDEIIRQSMGSQMNNLEDTYNTISGLVVGFKNYSLFINSNPAIEAYLRALIEVINRIKQYTVYIILVEIGKDLSFKLIVKAVPELKGALFTEVLTMKNKNNALAEMILSMESLENILTAFN
jgi:ABC-type multidrug transport system ATPase subunit